MSQFAEFLYTIVRDNQENFRVMGPDETESNKLGKIYEAGKKVWVNGYLPEDEDGGNLSPEGRVMEMLSEHTVEGWLEGYILSGPTDFSTATSLSFTSSTPWSTSTPSGSRRVLRCPGVRPYPL